MAEDTRPIVMGISPELAFWPGCHGVNLEISGKTQKYYPFLKAGPRDGGLGDHFASTSIALKEKGVRFVAAIPYLPKVSDLRRGMTEIEVERMKNLGYLIEEETQTLRDAGFSEVNGANEWDRDLILVDHPVFHNLGKVYDGDGLVFSLAFQKELLNTYIPKVNPDLIHTHDWTTGLVGTLSDPNIKTVHSVHNIHCSPGRVSKEWLYNWGLPMYNADKLFLGEGMDGGNVRFQLSGIHGADAITTVSQQFLLDTVNGHVPEGTNPHFVEQMRNKLEAGRAYGIVNAPDPSYNSETDSALARTFSLEDMVEAKRENKMAFQRKMRMSVDPDAPLLLWTNRAEHHQKRANYLDALLPALMHDHQWPPVQVAIVANGPYMNVFKRTIHELERNGFRGRIGITSFDDSLERLGFGGADANLVPSAYEPCGLPQLKGPKYGVLPIVRLTGGLKETVPLERESVQGYGFGYEHDSADGLSWAIRDFLHMHATNRPHVEMLQYRAKAFADENFTIEKQAEAIIPVYENTYGGNITA